MPLLKEAIESGRLTVSKAKRILPVLKDPKGCASDWIEKASTLPQRQVEREVAQRNPEKSVRERVRPLGQNQIEIRCVVSLEVEKKMERVRQLVGGNATLSKALEAMVDQYLQSNDPLEKAKRAVARKSKKAVASAGVKKSEAPASRQVSRSIPALVKHQVQLRDRGQCRHLLPGGTRCESRRFLQFHHVVHFESGGESTLGNLVLLCSSHHQRVHWV